MAEREQEYAEGILCTSVYSARGSEGYVENVKFVRGRPSKERLEEMGLVPLGRHPDPDRAGLMTIADPAVDRVNSKIRERKAENVKRTRDNFKKNMKKPAAPAAPQGG